MRPVDFDVPVGWGHIAGVKWGKESGFPVLCVHGIQDNAGTFDRLIPLLPKRFFWVAIDLPGHGKSSHFESGHPLEYTHLVYAVKMVIDHFKWEKFYLMGHSLGAQLSAFIAALYPEKVVKTIFIDGLLPPFKDADIYVKVLRSKFNAVSLLESSLSKKTPPSYSYDDAVDRLVKNRPSFILPEAAKVLIKRSLTVSGDGFRFSTDQRLKILPLPIITFDQCLNVLNSIKCPCLLIIAKDSLRKIDNGGGVNYYSAEAITALGEYANFTCKQIEGHHDVHLNDPEGVAALISPFLDDTKCSL